MSYNMRVIVDYYGIDGRSVRGFADMKRDIDKYARGLTCG